MKRARGWVRQAPIEIEGQRFIPVKDVEHRTGIKSATLHSWTKQGMTSNGWPFHAFRNEKGFHFIREDTVQRLEQRFCYVPGNEPAGNVRFGLTPAQTGYIPINQAPWLIEELQRWFSSSKLEGLAKQTARGHKIPGVELELIVDPLHHDKRFASERSLRALIQAAKEGKI